MNTFSCHKTTSPTWEDEDEGVDTPPPEQQHCAGAMLVLIKEGRPNIMMRIAEQSGWLSCNELQEGESVYASLEEFAQAEGDLSGNVKRY